MKTPTKLPSPVSAGASLKDLKHSVRELGTRATIDVDAVRKAFTSGIAPIQTVSSGSAADFIARFGQSEMAAGIVNSTARFGINTSVVGTIVTPPKPELDHVEIAEDRAVGTLDSFYARIVASVESSAAAGIRFIRVLRSTNGPVKGLSKPAFSALIDSAPITSRSKSTEGVSNAARQIDALGVANKLTDFVTDDTFTTQRAVVSSGTLRQQPAPLNTNRKGVTQSGLIRLQNADRAVLENVTFYVNQRTTAPAVKLVQPLLVGQQQGLNVLQGSAVTGIGSAVQTGNSAGFYEIARIPIANAKTVGAFLEIEHIDPAVVFGSSYSYYVVAVDKDGIESPRSRLVSVNVVRTHPPASPEVFYSVIAGHPRFSIRCSGSFVDHVEVFRKGGVVPESVRVLSTREAMVDERTPVLLNSGFYHIGDVGMGVDRSSTYIDRNATGGSKLEYRFYTVDSFGLKSATPFSCSLTIPDHGNFIPLALPSITVEQGQGGRVMNISVSCDDSRVTQFVIGRRDLTSNQFSYQQPTQPDHFNLGTTTVKRSRSRIGPRLDANSMKAWSGIFAAVSGAASFSDFAVEFDRTYQYSVYAVDIRGNRSSGVPARPISISTKPVSDRPTAVTASVIFNGDTPTGVRIDWIGGTSDFSPNELIGDQDVLAATIRRSVYQVERKQVGLPNWEALPATTATHFVDIVSDREPPKFRPPYAVASTQYDYRVIAMQSGAFLSTYTDPVRVLIAPELSPPSTVWIRSTPSGIRPFNVVVSWNYNGAFVDGWEIERASVNKIFSAKILSMDSREARSLNYERVARVTRESSRGHGISSEVVVEEKMRVGNRLFIDSDIDLANSYFYRVRAFDSAGRTSSWAYAGISLTDSPHDRKLFTVLSDKEKAELSLDARPISKWRNG